VTGFEQLNESLAQIDRELALIRQEPVLLNSFTLWLPSGGARDIIPGANYSFMDEPDESLGGRTKNQFLADMDAAIVAEGISLERIRWLQSHEYVGGDAVYTELVILTLPVYKALRLLGYSPTSMGAYHDFTE
jgi:hypothetical protein